MLEPHTWQAIGWIAVALFGIAGGVNQIVRLVDRFKGHPPAEQLKLNADSLERRVTTLEHTAAEAMQRRRAMHEKIDAVKEEIREETKRDLGQVYDRLNTLGESVAGLHRDTTHQNTQLLRIDTKLDRLMERLGKG